MKRRDDGKTAAAKSSADARSHPRRECYAMCKIGAPRTTLAGSVIDASASGVQCRVPNGLVPNVGETVYLEWPDTTANFATVVWTRGSRIGFRFSAWEPDYLDKFDTVFLGLGNYCRIIASQIARMGHAPAS